MDELSSLNNSREAKKIAVDSMERYSGSPIKEFGQYLLITNFPRYVDYFAISRDVKISEGSTFRVAHHLKEGISILDFKMGSPMAALVIDLCAYLPIKGIVMLGMAGGLRERYKVGDYFLPVASIRGDGTSDVYFPPEVPALANFAVQRLVMEVLEQSRVKYRVGITYTTNRRFWEFNEDFKQHLLATRPQAIEMECATLFIASYKHKIPLGALLLISDLPLKPHGVKTKEGADHVFSTFTSDHVEKGIEVIERLKIWQETHGHNGELAKKVKKPPAKRSSPLSKTKAKKPASARKLASSSIISLKAKMSKKSLSKKEGELMIAKTLSRESLKVDKSSVKAIVTKKSVAKPTIKKKK